MKNTNTITYPLTADSWGREELISINNVVKSNRFTMGDNVKKFENDFSNFFKVKYSVMVNSGSSANLLMIAALFFRKKNKFKAGDEIIVPSVSWGTTFFPLTQYGLKCVFVDISLETLNINEELIEKSISKKTKAIFVVNLLGNPANFKLINKIAKKYNLLVIEDNCESLGAVYNNKYTGTIGEMGSFSFFFSHHLQTIEGGMICTNNRNLYEIIVSLRAHGWLRDLPSNNSIYKKSGNNFKDSFKFILPGYNLRPSEINGAIGIQQLKKLNTFLKQRNRNAKAFKSLFGDSDYLTIQKEIGKSSWFGFGIVLKGKLKNKRDELIKLLNKKNIETRPIVAGNFLKNPVIKFINHRKSGKMKNAEYIHKNGFFVGNDHRDLSSQLKILKKTIEDFSQK